MFSIHCARGSVEFIAAKVCNRIAAELLAIIWRRRGYRVWIG